MYEMIISCTMSASSSDLKGVISILPQRLGQVCFRKIGRLRSILFDLCLLILITVNALAQARKKHTRARRTNISKWSSPPEGLTYLAPNKPGRSTNVRLGAVGDVLSILRISVLNCFDPAPIPDKPISALAASTILPKLFCSVSCSWNFISLTLSSSLLVAAGWIWTFSWDLSPRRRINSVAKRVQSPSEVGKAMPERASRVELFPDDWLPQTIIWGRSTLDANQQHHNGVFKDRVTY